jgi:hypothetical protein
MLKTKALVDGHKRIKLTLDERYQPIVVNGAPPSFFYCDDFMIRERLPHSRVNTLV